MRAAPSSVAFSTMKSVRAFLIGANISQTSGGSRCGAAWATSTSEPPRLPTASISAVQAPSRPLKTSIRAPGPSRITAPR